MRGTVEKKSPKRMHPITSVGVHTDLKINVEPAKDNHNSINVNG